MYIYTHKCVFIQFTCKICYSFFKDYFPWVFLPLAKCKERGSLVYCLTTDRLPQIRCARCITWYSCLCYSEARMRFSVKD